MQVLSAPVFRSMTFISVSSACLTHCLSNWLTDWLAEWLCDWKSDWWRNSYMWCICVCVCFVCADVEGVRNNRHTPLSKHTYTHTNTNKHYLLFIIKNFHLIAFDCSPPSDRASTSVSLSFNTHTHARCCAFFLHSCWLCCCLFCA